MAFAAGITLASFLLVMAAGEESSSFHLDYEEESPLGLCRCSVTCQTDPGVLVNQNTILALLARQQEQLEHMQRQLNDFNKTTAPLPCQRNGVHYFKGISGHEYFFYAERKDDNYVWVRLGRGGQQGVWNYDDEDTAEVQINVLNSEEIQALSGDLLLTDLYVESDVTFRLQADDSSNPSSVKVRFLPDLTSHELVIGSGRDHTSISFKNVTRITLTCREGGTSVCGTNNLPPAGATSPPLLIEQLHFKPRKGRPHRNQWFRNKYSWCGSKYFVWGKLFSCL